MEEEFGRTYRKAGAALGGPLWALAICQLVQRNFNILTSGMRILLLPGLNISPASVPAQEPPQVLTIVSWDQWGQ